MKIVHIHLLGPYTDNWGYQENILPAVQARQGHKVTVITNVFSHTDNGQIVGVPERDYYIEGVHIIRKRLKKYTGNKILDENVFMHYPLYSLLTELSPDCILLHGLGGGISNFEIKKYLDKNTDCILVGDVHQDFYNSPQCKKDLAHIVFYSLLGYFKQILFPYYRAVFGLTPNCIEYAEKELKVPSELIKLAPLGFDPQKIDYANRTNIRKKFREKNGINSDDIVVIHGGKIIPRRKTEITIAAVKKARETNKKIKLVVFGGIADELKPEILGLIKENNDWIIYLGHLKQAQYIEAFLASDIGLFPGGQSAIWQEAIGSGLPLVLDRNQNVSYLDRGGNIAFAENCSVEEVAKTLSGIIDSEDYIKMRKIAETEGRDFLSYERISDYMLYGK